MPTVDHTGRHFGRLAVLSPAPRRASGGQYWLCLCECGREAVVLARNLVTGSTRSCGCLRDELRARKSARAQIHVVEAEVATRDRTGCWLWAHSRSAKGYGLTSRNRRSTLVTHVVLEFDGKPRPPAPGNQALHACDTPSCYNPDHLRWGTPLENSRDMVERKRTSDRRGEKSGKAKLTDSVVREIRRRVASGESQTAVALALGIPLGSIGGIVHRHRWAHVLDGEQAC